MKKYLQEKWCLIRALAFILFYTSIASDLLSQNLIKNGYFNDTIQLGGGQSIYAKGWLDVPTSSSPDYFNDWNPILIDRYHNFIGTQNPKFPEGYLGLVAYDQYYHGQNAREYAQGELQNPLIRDSSYCFRIWISLADSSNYALKNQIGAYFSNTKVDSPNVFNTILNFNPQINFQTTNFITDTMNWLRYDASFIANGGERYVVIGNFNPDSTLDTMKIIGGINQILHGKTYYYIDGLWLSKCDSLPSDTLTYLAKKNYLESDLSIYPVPAQERLFIRWEVESKGETYLQLFNALGKEVLTKNLKEGYLHTIDRHSLPSGIYILKVYRNNEEVSTRKVVFD